MKKSLMISLMVAALVCVFALPAVIAGNAPADTMVLKAPAGAKMTKAPVDFTHKKHAEDYKIDCMVCHHKATDKNAITGCSVEGCHADASKAAKKDPKGFYQAWHSKKSDASCVACHKKEKKAGKKVPVACKECHPKK
ncbi:cytochrome c3 family protein [Pseudodesulfovibrio sp. zrk46]|uniref:cytochrome c3 family protein n=1 Tax=Pseudodesulfovibrio sp. zrk46 TaxID=2725288 RepID=UPI001448CEE9|nr:cytochrome c3 family protein [Pseudodesulfovibrio sp. zrk46]QJB56477.1 cytochrome c3 family protein [Pseudodesulfovibrio sp. zrk46]